MKAYDLVVLGAGPGGYIAAIRAAQLGLNVGIVEKDELGGTCLNVGCVPTKMLLGATELLDELAVYKKLRIMDGVIQVDLPALQRRKDQVVRAFRKGIERLLDAHGVEVVRGFGRITDEHTVEVVDVGARHAVPLPLQQLLIATGSSPSIPQGSPTRPLPAPWRTVSALDTPKPPRTLRTRSPMPWPSRYPSRSTRRSHIYWRT